jgi:hypothetical protein
MHYKHDNFSHNTETKIGRHKSFMFCSLEQGSTDLRGKGSNPLLWDGSRAGRRKNNNNTLIYCEFSSMYTIYKYIRVAHKTRGLRVRDPNFKIY